MIAKTKGSNLMSTHALQHLEVDVSDATPLIALEKIDNGFDFYKT